MQFEIAVFSGLGLQFAEALSIRTRVFVEEQNVPIELERDSFDAVADHVLVSCDGRWVGTGRVFPDPELAETARLGRVAVLKEYRGLGLGKLVIEELLRIVGKNTSYRQVVIHAQKAVVDLYAGLGFRPVGAEFVEAGIVHQEMVFDKSCKRF